MCREVVEYKYVVKNADGTIDKWQANDNLKIEVPVAQGVSGRRRGVLVLDTWAKAAAKKSSWARTNRQQPGSWRSTPYSSVPAGSRSSSSSSGVAVHTEGPRFGNAIDIDNASAAVAARSYYSMMDHAADGSSSGVENIRDPVRQQQDPNVMQHWTDKPRFAAAHHQAHQDPWNSQSAAYQEQQVGCIVGSNAFFWARALCIGTVGCCMSCIVCRKHAFVVMQDCQSSSQGQNAPNTASSNLIYCIWHLTHCCCITYLQEQYQPRIFVPQPQPGSSPEEYARWQALQSVMAALAHSAELDHWVEDPTDPRMLAADRRLAALTASLGAGVDGVAAAAAAMV